MYYKIVKIRNTGEQLVQESEDYLDDLDELKAALDKFTPGVYKAYMVYNKRGDMILSKGLFGIEED